MLYPVQSRCAGSSFVPISPLDPERSFLPYLCEPAPLALVIKAQEEKQERERQCERRFYQ
jgi:hypothetical protein